MSIYKDKPTGQWRFDFDRRINGARVRRRQLLPQGWSRSEADAFDRKESAALYAVATGIARPRHTIGEAVALYYRERIPELKAGANAKREIEAWKDWWDGRALDDLATVCQEYAADQAGALKPATIKNRIAYLRSACRWAWKRHSLGDHDPGEKVVAPEVKNARTTTVARADVLRLARACQHRGVRALIWVLYFSGMRVSEAQRAARRDGCFVLDDTKNGEPRIIPIHSRALAASREPMPKRSEIDYWWPMAREACELRHVRLHDLRHTAATEMVNAGEDLATVGKVLGHKSPASTQRYSHHSTARQAVAVGKIGRRLA